MSAAVATMPTPDRRGLGWRMATNGRRMAIIGRVFRQRVHGFARRLGRRSDACSLLRWDEVEDGDWLVLHPPSPHEKASDMAVFARFAGETVAIQTCRTDTIAAMKAKIDEKLGLCQLEAATRLCFGGRPLVATTTVEDCNIHVCIASSHFQSNTKLINYDGAKVLFPPGRVGRCCVFPRGPLGLL